MYYVKKRITRCPYSIFHLAMFHGIAERPGAKYPLLDYGYGDNLSLPLSLTHNIHRIPRIFQPNTNAVVNREVKEAIASLSHVEFLRVDTAKVFYEQWSEDKNPPARMSRARDEEAILSKYRDDPALHSRFPDYYELIVPVWSRLPQDMRTGRVISVRTEESRVPIEIEVNSTTLDTYPILWRKGLFISARVWTIVHAWFDPDYFEVINCKE